MNDQKDKDVSHLLGKTSSITYKKLIFITIILVLISLVTVPIFKWVFKQLHSTKQTHINQNTVVDSDVEYWTCPMHSFVKEAKAGTCPICGMDLVPVKKGLSTGPSSFDEKTFNISLERQQLIGVKLTTVELQNIEKRIRTVGTITLDETKIVEVQTKFSGWIDKVFANQTYQYIKKGDPLFTIYSPELVATQEEYLLAQRAAKILNNTSYQTDVKAGDSLLNAVHKRLERWDISQEQINSLAQTGKSQKTLTIYSPATGYITAKNVFQNMQVTPESKLYTVADYSSVWANADIYETDIAFVKKGQAVVMTVPVYPDKKFYGKINFLWPNLTPQTRTLKARLEFLNPNLILKPEMYADVEIKTNLGKRLMVPESAIIRTGKSNLAFVSLGEGSFAIRDLKLGIKVDEQYEVLEGLNSGDQIVTTANFLVGAESKLQGMMSSWGGQHHHD